VDPRLARMLIAASHHACLSEMLIVTSFLEIQDPRERPADAQTQADQAHAVFADHRSDFIAILNVWNTFREKSGELSGNQLRKWCRESFLSFVRMREWQELHRQLKDAVEEIELRANQQPADYANLHQAILTGFLGNIGTLEEKREYLGARGSRFTIAPGTPLASKPPKWIVAGSIMETTRVFARMVANIEPPWIESAGEHLLKRAYNEPQWVEQKGFVGALESVSLYGLTLVGQRRVNYGSVMPKEARQIFVREALVEGRSSLRAEFLKRNAELRKQVEAREAKIRRRDILVDDQAICDFYLQRLPEHINSVAAMEKWLRPPGMGRSEAQAGESFLQRRHSVHPGTSEGFSVRGNEEQLRLSLSDLMRRDAPEITADQFPDSLDIGGNRLALTYKFEPGQDDDGATLTVPEPLLVTLNAEQLAWAVPGWRLEKLTALLRALPKEQRKHFVPVPDAAARCMQATQDSVSISAAIAAWITRESGVPISSEQLHALPIPEYLQLNVCVTSLDGRFIRQSRNVTTLRREVRSVSAPQSLVDTQQEIFRAWDFGDLPEQRVVERRGVTFTVYPAIAPKGEGVEIAELGTLSEAEAVSRQGLLRLALLALPQQAKFARQHFLGQRELVLLSQSLKTARPLADEFVERVFIDCFIAHAATLPRSKVQFDALLDSHRARIGEVTTRLAATLVEILQARRTVNALIAKLPATMKGFSDEASAQLALLMPDDFLHIAEPWLAHLPRYLRALARRLERAPGNAKRDAELARLVVPFVAAYKQLSMIKSGSSRPELERLRWMIEEYRVSLFAQDLKTSLPVSDKRLAEQVERAKVEARS
jgi:ATP-dependent helicase HrpA